MKIGDRFGRLTVTGLIAGQTKPRRVHPRALVACDCGSFKTVQRSNLASAMSASCGCLQRELAASRQRRHGHAEGKTITGEYRAWVSMLTRCYNSRSVFFSHYGARGIAACERWRHDFAAFLADMGPRPSPKHSLDRIDNDGGYEPGNCRWATRSEQARNKRNTQFITAYGVTLPIAEWAEATGINLGTLRSRIRRGHTAEEAIPLYVGGM